MEKCFHINCFRPATHIWSLVCDGGVIHSAETCFDHGIELFNIKIPEGLKNRGWHTILDEKCELNSEEKLVIEMYRWAKARNATIRFSNSGGASFLIPGMISNSAMTLKGAFAFAKKCFAHDRFMGMIKNKVYPHLGENYETEPYDDGMMRFSEWQKWTQELRQKGTSRWGK